MSGNDLFADLLAGTRKNKNVSNVPMAQRMSMSSSSLSSTGNGVVDHSINLDFLDKHLSGSSVHIQAPQPSSGDDINDILSSFSGSSRSTPQLHEANSGLSQTGDHHQPRQQQQSHIESSSSLSLASGHHHQQQQQTADLLEGFFSSPVPETPPKEEDAVESPQPDRKETESELKDEALAELVDMGFPIQKAGEALSSTKSGHDVNGAINYLMSQAHSESKNEVHRSHNQQWPETQDDKFGTVVNDLSSDLMSKASSFLQTGRKKISEGIEMYRQQQYERNGHQPAWMRNQATYKTKSLRLPGDEEEEMLPEDIKRITEQHRARLRQFRHEREEHQVHTDENGPVIPSRPPPPPTRRGRSNKDNRSNGQYRLDKPDSAPHRTSAPIKSKTPDEALLDIMNSPAAPAVPKSRNTNQKKDVAESHSIAFAAPVSVGFTTARSNGARSFKTGDFPQSLIFYKSALSELPEGHPLQVIILSNISTVYEKLGNAKEQLSSSSKGLELISKISKDNSDLDRIYLEKDKVVKDLWIKLLSRKAEALEHLERFKEALEAYSELLNHGVSSKPILDGKRRCVDVLQPKSKTTAKARLNNTITNNASGEALKRVKEQDAKEERIENEKFRLHDKVEETLNQWTNGKKENIRALLASLHEILWPELNWKPVSMTDLVLDKKVKITYMKAVSRVHPDKIGRDVTTERRMIANGVFITLNEAWEKYKQD